MYDSPFLFFSTFVVVVALGRHPRVLILSRRFARMGHLRLSSVPPYHTLTVLLYHVLSVLVLSNNCTQRFTLVFYTREACKSVHEHWNTGYVIP